jgi:hypothetical protein
VMRLLSPDSQQCQCKSQNRKGNAIDQGEELFLAEGQDEARIFLAVLCDLSSTRPDLLYLMNYVCQIRQCYWRARSSVQHCLLSYSLYLG